MKTVKINLLVVLLLLIISPLTIFSQNENKRPEYITVTVGHWNMDYENFNKDKWIATEREFLDNVVKKNEFILGTSVYLHRYTPDNSEIVFVNTYGSWADIEKANKRNQELIKEVWKDEKKREEYFKKKNAYYTMEHSDEIYVPVGGAKFLKSDDAKKELIWLVVKGHFAFPEDGSKEEFENLNKEYLENVINKNDLIKGYFQHMHAWGSDKTEFSRVFAVESMADLDMIGEKSNELFKSHWKDEAKRKEFEEKVQKYFTPKHGDYIYTSIPELSK
ncbi:hypothetical protein [Tenacibaculum aiptasiae]|uniref:hypothetical protein n=1 Tax=Tenacibaculum aiptasiae TaxID=426481 RepID=UPI003B59542D